MYCRRKASQRRWYRRNAESVIEKTAARMPAYRAKLKALRDQTTDEELDRKALDMLRREGIRA
jgi:hypothetical protein